ncbi:MAG: hypothetical protein ACTHMX_13615, partial [Thermomicrobiales bacterium]
TATVVPVTPAGGPTQSPTITVEPSVTPDPTRTPTTDPTATSPARPTNTPTRETTSTATLSPSQTPVVTATPGGPAASPVVVTEFPVTGAGSPPAGPSPWPIAAITRIATLLVAGAIGVRQSRR